MPTKTEARAWQRMLSGRRLDLLDPSPLDVEIEDIAHGLSRVARWNGQTSGAWSFSVAQHCLLVENLTCRLKSGAPRSLRCDTNWHINVNSLRRRKGHYEFIITTEFSNIPLSFECKSDCIVRKKVEMCFECTVEQSEDSYVISWFIRQFSYDRFVAVTGSRIKFAIFAKRKIGFN